MIAAMNGLGYDAAVLGNHEFNYGMGTVDNVVRSSLFLGCQPASGCRAARSRLSDALT